MCRCLQSIWEDFYWHCIEEKFCYDESIAHYNPDEDEYIVGGKTKNGLIVDANPDNNNPPICAQPVRLQRNCSTISSKIHEDDFHRDIQTNVPVLAPEILAVFRNSQIFHEHSQKISKNLSAKPTFITQPTTQHNITKVQHEQNVAEEKLLSRLEGEPKGDTKDEEEESSRLGAVTIRKFSSILEEDEFNFDTDAPKSPKFLAPPDENRRPKSLKHVQSVPHLPIRPSSETDIFTITSSFNRISMTPEIPSISFTTLPKNYETPTMERYRESVSLQSIQTANCMRTAEFDFSMPRYFRHSELYPQTSDPPTQTGSVESVLKRSTSTQNLKQLEKSKRLKALRGTLPPLLIGGHEKDNH
ncbi:uncharacterized protein LOC129804710 isoform X1 [Phlebotomus papatasi]|uniref:uncharacterized protein LOC129804710 isoform X1 n=1 Tax=Phlebotomus papatasi TaxID=29031 RepID=UPI00248444F3|nr:uncharacterized protein LOC129804710 isoform X1 [Phlebotomus papatasi]